MFKKYERNNQCLGGFYIKNPRLFLSIHIQTYEWWRILKVIFDLRIRFLGVNKKPIDGIEINLIFFNVVTFFKLKFYKQQSILEV